MRVRAATGMIPVAAPFFGGSSSLLISETSSITSHPTPTSLAGQRDSTDEWSPPFCLGRRPGRGRLRREGWVLEAVQQLSRVFVGNRHVSIGSRS